MKKKTILILFLGILIFTIFSVGYYLTHGYKIKTMEKNNISQNYDAQLTDTLLPASYIEYDKNKIYWGFINLDGKVAIKFQYEKVSNFDENNLAIVELDGKYGLINTIDSKLLKVNYDSIKYMGNDIYFYQKGNSGHLATYNIGTHEMQEFKSVNYDTVGKFSDNLAYVVKDDKLGYIDPLGKVVIQLNYDYKKDFDFNFYNGYAFIYKNNKYGIINNQGTIVLNPQFDEVTRSYELQLDFTKNEAKDASYSVGVLQGYQIVPFRKGNLWGYVSSDGTILKKATYTEAYPFMNGKARVKLDTGYYHYIDTNFSMSGQYYESASDFYNGYASVKEEDKNVGLINTQFNYVIQPNYDYVGNVSQNNVLVIKDSKSEYKNIINSTTMSINVALGDDMTDCQVMLGSDKSTSNTSRTLQILSMDDGKRLYPEIEVKSYHEIFYKGKYYLVIDAYEKEYNLEYLTYLDQDGHLIWKVYK